MDAAIVGLVGLGGLYAIANQKDNKEGFELILYQIKIFLQKIILFKVII